MNILVMKSPTSLVDHSLSKARLAAAQRFDVRSCLDHPRPSNLTDSEWFDQELLDMSDENSNGYVEDTPSKNMDLTTEHFMFYDPLIKVSQIILVIHSMSLHWGELLHVSMKRLFLYIFETLNANIIILLILNILTNVVIIVLTIN